jgi:hypothetical protein
MPLKESSRNVPYPERVADLKQWLWCGYEIDDTLIIRPSDRWEYKGHPDLVYEKNPEKIYGLKRVSHHHGLLHLFLIGRHETFPIVSSDAGRLYSFNVVQFNNEI